MYLYHYFERAIGAFKNLSDLSDNEAEEILQKIRKASPAPSMEPGATTNKVQKRF